MSEEYIQLIGLAILAILELYSVRAADYPMYAKFWDAVAKLAGAIANFFANLAMNARLAYYEAINA